MSRILVVESEPKLRALVTEVLGGRGHETVSVADGADVKPLLAGEGIDLVVAEESALPNLAVPGSITVLPLTRTFTAAALVAAVDSALGQRVARVVIAEDHVAVRASLVAFFEAQDDFSVVGEAANGWEAVKLARQEAPDFVLMDIRMPVMDGIEATRMIKSLRPETRVLLLSAYEQDELIDAGVAAGADGFLLKGLSGRELVASVREARMSRS